MPVSQTEEVVQNARKLTPGQTIQAEPWAFIGLALAAGLGLGILLRFKGLRKAVGLYLSVRRFV